MEYVKLSLYNKGYQQITKVAASKKTNQGIMEGKIGQIRGVSWPIKTAKYKLLGTWLMQLCE